MGIGQAMAQGSSEYKMVDTYDVTFEGSYSNTHSVNTGASIKFKDTNATVNGSLREVHKDVTIPVIIPEGYIDVNTGTKYDIVLNITPLTEPTQQPSSTDEYDGDWRAKIYTNDGNPMCVAPKYCNVLQYEIWLEKDGQTVAVENFTAGACWLGSSRELVCPYTTDNKIYHNYSYGGQPVKATETFGDLTLKGLRGASYNENSWNYVMGAGQTADHHVKFIYATTEPTESTNLEFTLGALFKIEYVFVSVVADDDVTVSGAGSYTTGENAYVSAKKQGYVLKGWKLSPEATEYVSTDNPYTFIVNKAVTLYPEFEAIPTDYTLAPGIQGVINISDDYPWMRTNIKPGLAFASTNQGEGETSSEGSITITPSELVSSYHLSFDWAVSSESGWDKMTIMVNGAFVDNNEEGLSGENCGSYATTEPLLGETVIDLRYSKDGSGDGGADTGYIYNIKCTPVYEENTIAYANKEKDGATDVMKPEDWDDYLKSHPNTIGYTDGTSDKTNVFAKVSGNEYKTAKLVVTDGEDFVLPKEINFGKTLTADQSIYTRNQAGYSWGTLYLPFDFVVSDANTSCEVYEFTGVEGDEMKFKRIANGTKVEALTPVMVKKNGEFTIKSLTTTNVKTSGYTPIKPGYIMNGKLKAVERIPDGYFISADKWWYTDYDNYPESVSLQAFRCYFTADDVPANARRASFTIVVEDENETTAIGEVTDGNVRFFDNQDTYYNLSGQKTNAQRGILITNGKKIIKK